MRARAARLLRSLAARIDAAPASPPMLTVTAPTAHLSPRTLSSMDTVAVAREVNVMMSDIARVQRRLRARS